VLVESRELDGAGRVLARRQPVRGRLDAMIDSVADHVDQRIAQLVDQLPVELGVLAPQHQADLFALRTRDVAHQSRHLAEQASHRNHAQRHGVVLQTAGDAHQLAHGVREFEIGGAAHLGTLEHERLRYHQFADQVHQVIELRRVQPDKAVCHRGLA
jgi:hypothetical protein